MELLTGVLTGTVAALIAFGAAAWAYRRTRADEREDAAKRERRERVGRVKAAVNSDLVLAAVNWKGLRIGTGVLKVHAALSDFIAAEWIEHEAVARWAMERLDETLKAVRPIEKYWLLPGHAKRIAAAIKPAGDAASALTLWEHRVVTDEWFRERLSEKEQSVLTPPPPRRRGR